MFFNKIKKITAAELQTKMQEEKLDIIDVRETDEFAGGHIPGAKNVPLSKVQGITLKKTTYIICQSGMRSKNATNHLQKKGYDVINVEGGMNAWSGKVVR